MVIVMGYIEKAILKHLTESKATDANPQKVMASEVWEPGYPQLHTFKTIDIDEGQTSYIIPVPGKLAAGTSFGAANVTYVDMTYNTLTLGNPVGINLGWTREYLEDCKWDALAPQLKEAGRSIEEKMFADVLSAMDTACTSNTFTLSGTVTWANFCTGVGKLAENDFKCDIVICHPSEYMELLQLQQFIDASYMGSDDPISTGILKTTLGVTVVSSSKCTDGKMYFIDSSKWGAIGIRRDRKVEEYSYPDDNLYGIVASVRYGIKVVLEKAVAIGSK